MTFMDRPLRIWLLLMLAGSATAAQTRGEREMLWGGAASIVVPEGVLLKRGPGDERFASYHFTISPGTSYGMVSMQPTMTGNLKKTWSNMRPLLEAMNAQVTIPGRVQGRRFTAEWFYNRAPDDSRERNVLIKTGRIWSRSLPYRFLDGVRLVMQVPESRWNSELAGVLREAFESFRIHRGPARHKKKRQRIAFTLGSTRTVGETFNLLVTVNSPLPPAVSSSNTNVVVVRGLTATAVGPGQAVLTATQKGDLEYYPAKSVRRILTVGPGDRSPPPPPPEPPGAPSGMILIGGGMFYYEDAVAVAGRRVAPFYLERHETAGAIWQEVADYAAAHGYDLVTRSGPLPSAASAAHPVTHVNWFTALKWCNARSEMEGLTPVYTVQGAVFRAGEQGPIDFNPSADGYRLPTALEWEWAARGGRGWVRYSLASALTTPEFMRFSGGNNIEAVAWYDGNTSGPQPVGRKNPNQLGLYDMSGNVSEWCSIEGRWTAEYPHYRGGSWQSGAGACWTTARTYKSPFFAGPADGFRAARNVVE